MTNRKAIKILKQQIDKLKNDPSNRSSAWSNETKRYIVEFFGENSIEDTRYWRFGAWWIISPSIDPSIPNTVEYQEKQVIELLESFISTIKNLGITKKPKLNFIYTMKTEFVIATIIGITGVAFALGTAVGILNETKETSKLSIEVTNLKKELIKCSTQKSETRLK